MSGESDAPITDEGIEQVVQMVQAAEVYATSMGCSVSEGARQLLKMSQVMAKVKAQGSLESLARLAVGSKVQ
jgi:hypothetical protein